MSGNGRSLVVSAPPQRFLRPTWAEVDLDVLRRNQKKFRAAMPAGTKVMFVIKADAYGHGAVQLARWTQECRTADWLGVSSAEEGIALREAGVRLPILILGSLYPFETFLAGVQYGLTPTVASLEGAHRLSEVAKKVGRRVKCHLKLDTGMGRIGMSWPSGLAVAKAVAGDPGLELEGVYTHLACGDEDPRFTRLQLDRFRGALDDVRKAGLKVGLRHAANSFNALAVPASRFDLVRPGIALYGLQSKGYEPVLSLKTRIVFMKNVRAGTPIGYGAGFVTKRPARVATLPVGYADGVPRLLSNRGSVLVRGKRCRIVGTVTMDMTMIDATGLSEAHVGDEAVLLGAQGRERVTMTDWAKLSGTIPYEIATGLSARVPRVYLQP